MHMRRPCLASGACVFVLSLVACSSDTATAVGSDAGSSSETGSSDSGVDSGAVDSAIDTGSADAASDTGSDTGSDAGIDSGPPWDPSKLGGSLVVWLDGSKGVQVNNGVAKWADQTANGNDANQQLVAYRPAQAANVVNGLPVIRFDGASNQFLSINDAASIQFGAGDFAIMMVAAWTNAPSADNSIGYGSLWVKVETGGNYNGAALFGNNPAAPNGAVHGQLNAGFAVSSPGTTYNDGTFHYVGMVRTNATFEVRADGTGATAPNGTTDVSATGQSVYIGSRYPNVQMLRGDVAEVVAIKGTLSGADLAKLEKYLKTKYAL